ncbi:E3 ubiquitin-protein ligase MARCH2 [Astathelohania contejeani]|uniref:E3 ubiquitin-protein ligase MARCH2 n=1 Tax=Astathelohania contejeani TaxID=164912 RepID=A0ABQ7I299_9MICR|nr:E3 ubiquitin-protein ligase MARCH2 [Thelohania contejeani]
MEDLESESDIVCKICLQPPNLKEGLGNPCKCIGSIGYAHRSCLNRWIETTSISTCEICQSEYVITGYYSAMTWYEFGKYLFPLIFKYTRLLIRIFWAIFSLLNGNIFGGILIKKMIGITIHTTSFKSYLFLHFILGSGLMVFEGLFLLLFLILSVKYRRIVANNRLKLRYSNPDNSSSDDSTSFIPTPYIEDQFTERRRNRVGVATEAFNAIDLKSILAFPVYKDISIFSFYPMLASIVYISFQVFIFIPQFLGKAVADLFRFPKMEYLNQFFNDAKINPIWITQHLIGIAIISGLIELISRYICESENRFRLKGVNRIFLSIIFAFFEFIYIPLLVGIYISFLIYSRINHGMTVFSISYSFPNYIAHLGLGYCTIISIISAFLFLRKNLRPGAFYRFEDLISRVYIFQYSLRSSVRKNIKSSIKHNLLILAPIIFTIYIQSWLFGLERIKQIVDISKLRVRFDGISQTFFCVYFIFDIYKNRYIYNILFQRIILKIIKQVAIKLQLNDYCFRMKRNDMNINRILWMPAYNKPYRERTVKKMASKPVDGRQFDMYYLTKTPTRKGFALVYVNPFTFITFPVLLLIYFVVIQTSIFFMIFSSVIVGLHLKQIFYFNNFMGVAESNLHFQFFLLGAIIISYIALALSSIKNLIGLIIAFFESIGMILLLGAKYIYFLLLWPLIISLQLYLLILRLNNTSYIKFYRFSDLYIISCILVNIVAAINYSIQSHKHEVNLRMKWRRVLIGLSNILLPYLLIVLISNYIDSYYIYYIDIVMFLVPMISWGIRNLF